MNRSLPRDRRSPMATRSALHALGFGAGLLFWSGPFLWLWFAAIDGRVAAMLVTAGLSMLSIISWMLIEERGDL